MTTWASSQVPPAPPASSDTSGSVRPPSSSARQSLSGHVPFSEASISSLVARSLKRRVTVSERSERNSVVIVAGPAGSARIVGGLPWMGAADVVAGPAGSARIVGGLPWMGAADVRSSQSETSGNDPAQNLARAAAQRERWRGLRDVAEHLLQVGARVQRRLEVE